MRFLKISTIIIFFCITSVLEAQKTNPYQSTDKIALQIPESQTKSTIDIARYVDSHFSNQSDKSRAIFVWIASNIQYDFENMLAVDFYENPEKIIEKVLNSHKGVCMHYAELYTKIANETGIKTYMITGYTKQNGFVEFIPHAWCASQIDSVWYLFDTTWGSGYIQNAKFVRKLNNYYYKVKPEQLVKSHIPFDPLWQFINYPVSNQDFAEGKTSIDKKKPFFNFTDTLKTYESETEIERLISANRRITNNGVKNYLILNVIQQNKQQIDIYNNNLMVEAYNQAVNSFNKGISQLNAFINYRNNQFNPKKSDEEIKQMIADVDVSFDNARADIKNIKKANSTTAGSILQLIKSIDEAELNLNEQKSFLDKYLKTGKLFRKTLFVKYTWMGIPIN